MNCSPPGSCVHGILLASTLEWIAIPFSRGSSQTRDWTCVSCIVRRIPHHWATMSFLIASHWVIFAPYKDKFWEQGMCLLNLSVLDTRKGLGMWCWQNSCFMNERILLVHTWLLLFLLIQTDNCYRYFWKFSFPVAYRFRRMCWDGMSVNIGLIV